MSVGSSINKITVNFSRGCRMFKFMGGFKPNHTGAVLGTSKCKDIQHINQQLNSLSVHQKSTERFHFSHPKIDVTIQKIIIEPEKSLKISFELPIRNSMVTALDFPLHTEKEIKEPGKVISKKAKHMIQVRRRKMRKHKRKKYQKKYRTELYSRRLKRKQEKEANFQVLMRSTLSEADTFSAENYVDNLLAKVHWKKPVTKVKGRLAPQWVIKEHLEAIEEKQILAERLKECSK